MMRLCLGLTALLLILPATASGSCLTALISNIPCFLLAIA